MQSKAKSKPAAPRTRTRKTTATPASEQAVAPAALPGAPAATPVQNVSIPLVFSNQDLINAFASAASSLGLDQWALLNKAGFDVTLLAVDRIAKFPGPPIEQMPNLSDSERALLQRELLTWMVQSSQRVGVINALSGVNLRNGPTTEGAILSQLPNQTLVQILGQVQDWLFVFVQGQAGYLRQDLVAERTGPNPGPQPGPGGGLNAEQTLISNIWRQFGEQITTLAAGLNIDPGVAVAVLAAESGGVGHGADGRMIIRFENHLFYSEWGKANQAAFDQHFRFDPKTTWQGHQWNPGDGNWRAVHSGSQSSEWAVFDFARGLDERAAMASISMGTTQIMGFNFSVIGYPTVQAMFNAFQSDLRSQIQGFFDFVRSKNAVDAIRRQDFLAFATIYNGPGQAATYEKLIRNRLATFHELLPTLSALPRMALPMATPQATLEATLPAEFTAEALQSWQQRLLLITQLSIIQQSYWLRLATIADPLAAQQALSEATDEAIRQIMALRDSLTQTGQNDA